MATQRNCSACSDLQENSAEFVMNGVTDNVKASLENNTGFNPASGNDNCTDLNNANDCLVGNMEDEVDGYEVCDWKPFMVDFIHNLWSTLKAIIASICGIWKITENANCKVEALMNGQAFAIGEKSKGGSYVVAGQGVSFLEADENGNAIRDITILYIAGGLVRVNGSVWLHHNTNFTDAGYCYNFDDDGTGDHYSKSRTKNTHLGTATTYNAPGELLYEVRIKKSEYPMIKTLYSGIAAPTGGGAYQVNLAAHGSGDTCRGQRAGSPTYTVPDGWIYVQARLLNSQDAYPDGQKYTPRGFMGIRLKQNAIECDTTPSPTPTPTPTPTPVPPTGNVVATMEAALRSYNGDITTVSTVGGTVSPTSQTVVAGNSVTMTATANTGYTFKGWTTGITSTNYLSTNATFTRAVNTDTTFYAIFQDNSQHGTEITETVSDVEFVGESGTKSHTLAHTPVAGTIISCMFQINGQNMGGPTFVGGTSDSHTNSVMGITTTYDGNKTIAITLASARNFRLASVTYTY